MTSEESRETIPLVVLNSVLYGAAKAVDYLGMRGQIMLDKIGASIIDYLVKTGYVDDLNDMANVQNGYRRFFQQNG
jgi:enamine deaminase RidA (YjgF/YER057c/UK114 family)